MSIGSQYLGPTEGSSIRQSPNCVGLNEMEGSVATPAVPCCKQLN